MSKNSLKINAIDPKSEYTVEFECYSKILFAFEGETGLTSEQIVTRATEMAKRTFEQDGMFVTERIAKDHSYSISVLGVDTKTANLLSHPHAAHGPLKLIKS